MHRTDYVTGAHPSMSPPPPPCSSTTPHHDHLPPPPPTTTSFLYTTHKPTLHIGAFISHTPHICFFYYSEVTPPLIFEQIKQHDK